MCWVGDRHKSNQCEVVTKQQGPESPEAIRGEIKRWIEYTPPYRKQGQAEEFLKPVFVSKD